MNTTKEEKNEPKKTKKIPSIPRLQVYKNSRQILKNPLPFHHTYFEKLGDTFIINVHATEPVFFTRDRDLIRHVLQKQHKKYDKSPLQTVDLAKYIGHGLLTSNGEHWRIHRRMIQPAFHKKKLLGLMEIMLEAIRAELRGIQPNQNQDIFPLMGDLAFQVVAKSLFSRSDIQNEMARLKHMTEVNQQMLITEMRQPYLKWWYTISGKIGKHLKLAKDARTLLNSIIEERITLKEDKNDLLDMMLNARYEDGTAMPRKQLIDEVLILFAAGHETTANALSFTLFLLAKNQGEQEKAYQEAIKVTMDADSIIEDLAKLPYIKQCLEEAMRLYPPAYIIDRIAIEDDSFQEMHFPKGSMILMSIYELQRNANFWETPEVYKPERFNIANKKDYSEYYYPFGAGPRMCVGNNFAMYEMIMTVREILIQYHVTTTMKEVKINPLISLKPKGVSLQFSPRTN